MDWELYERHRATLLLLGIALLSFLMMSFQETNTVRSLKSMLLNASVPMHRLMSKFQGDASVTGGLATVDTFEQTQQAFPPRVQSLLDENARLRALLNIQERRWPRAMAAEVVGRDPHRWFQELVVNKGIDDGVEVDAPVVAVFGNETGLVGRIVDADAHVSRVMLLQDPLSAVAATLSGKDADDGVVEGSDRHELVLKYLDRNSGIKIGDWVVTSGLGARFPAGIPIGTVEDLSLDSRQLFLQARLRSISQGHSLHRVLILADESKRYTP